MRIHLLTPGTGHFYCGSCLRDNTLARALRKLGHDALTVPLYLPLMLENPSQDEADEGNRVQMGGINMYLQQKLPFKLPRIVQGWLDRPGLLRWAARRGNMTEAADLGEITLSMLRGENGRQVLEVEKLVQWMCDQERPDVIILSNIMLIGTVRRLKEALGIPIVVTLQGEAPFLDALRPEWADRAWDEVRERASEADAFVPVSHWYRDLMSKRLGIPDHKLHVVHNGIDVDQFDADQSDSDQSDSDQSESDQSESDQLDAASTTAAQAPSHESSTAIIGYLARMCSDKGLATLVDAFLLLKTSDRWPHLKLHIAGVALREDKPFIESIQRRIKDHNLTDDVEFSPNLDHAAKLTFLRSLTVFSVPATYGESFGLYLLEAMASGVPVIQPRHAAFPEIIERTGGHLCEPDSASSLSEALDEVLSAPQALRALSAKGRAAVFKNFSAERMARDVEQVCRIAAGHSD